jgi:hypothetical protein
MTDLNFRWSFLSRFLKWIHFHKLLISWFIVSKSISLLIYKACSKKDRTLAIKNLFYILSTVPFKVVPSTGDTPFPTFVPLLECFLESTFCNGAQFSYRIFLNFRVLKKRLNFLNSSPTSIESALRPLSAPSGRFWQQTAICPVSLWALVVELHPLNWARAQAVRRINPCSLCWLASYLRSSIFFLNTGVCQCYPIFYLNPHFRLTCSLKLHASTSRKVGS